MIITCPKCHYQRQAIDAQVNAAICPACGIVYKKWLARQAGSQTSPENKIEADIKEANSTEFDEVEKCESFREFISYVPDNIDPASFWARAFTLGCFALWGFYL